MCAAGLPRADPDGRLAGLRVALLPELGWGRGGLGHDLRDRIVQAIRAAYADAVESWDRRRRNLPPRITLTGGPAL